MLLSHYFRGATAIEARWKSVARPARGSFAGESLAAPFRRTDVLWDEATSSLTIRTSLFAPGVTYRVEAADDPGGPQTEVPSGSVPYPVPLDRTVPDTAAACYRLCPVP